LLSRTPLQPLAAGISVLFVISASTAWAAPPAVTNCNDSGTGSLRAAVTGAASGDTVDFSALTTADTNCASSKITLTTGAIGVTQQNLTIKGNGQNGISIYQTTATRVIAHTYPTSAGHLYVQDTKVQHGHVTSSGAVGGGCIGTAGSLSLINVEVSYCSVTTTGLSTDPGPPHAFGGGVVAGPLLSISGHSVLLHDSVYATNINVRAQGGCAETPGNFAMSYSIAAYCQAKGPVGGGKVRGGALELKSGAKITHSVIALSYSTFVTGGVDINSGTPAGVTSTISNSTIAYNNAHYLVGGVYANSGHVNINNTTIVLNTAGNDTYTVPPGTTVFYAAPGMSVSSYLGPVALSLQSSIIANNTSNTTQEDLSIGGTGGVFAGVTIDASNNLVRAYKSDVTLPTAHGNLQKGTCPLLGHVRNNGNGTYTFAPQSGSPVIDAGNNSANDPFTGVPAPYDQRGGPPPPPIETPPLGYPRVSGSSADIGAHEVQKTDIIFYTEMETGCQ
jgi:hypothetical protein